MAKDPAVALTYDPPGPQFAISEDCVMPAVTVKAALQNITPDPKITFIYSWKATLVFNGAGCANSVGRVIKHPDMSQSGPSNQFKIPFSQVRGGDLTVSVTVSGGALSLSATSGKLTVIGTNPSVPKLGSVVAAIAAFRKLMQVESGLRQFLTPTCPLFSSDGYGGVGICQLTQPTPTADQVWSWKENVAGGLSLYRTKESIARKYPETVRSSAEFKALVKAYNDQRLAKNSPAAAASAAAPAQQAAAPASLKPLDIQLPDYTNEQLERDTLRGFNGYAGGLHEYRVKVDANGLLVVTEEAGGVKGNAEWEPVTADARKEYYKKINLGPTHWGDTNYVEDVEKQAGF